MSWTLQRASDLGVVAMGGSSSVEEGKEFAYMAYQAAYGLFDRPGHA